MKAIIILSSFIAVVYTAYRFLFFLIINRKIKKAKARGESLKAIKKGLDIVNKIQNSSYPKFIPFYEWHGFINGLHPESRKYYLSNGKAGIKPRRWNNEK